MTTPTKGISSTGIFHRAKRRRGPLATVARAAVGLNPAGCVLLFGLLAGIGLIGPETSWSLVGSVWRSASGATIEAARGLLDWVVRTPSDAYLSRLLGASLVLACIWGLAHDRMEPPAGDGK